MSISALVALFLAGTLSAGAQDVLDQYIQEAFRSNLVLKERELELDKGLLAIKDARSRFMPTTWLETQYTLAQGGRTIDFPVGDLLNPVYSTLNQLTSSNNFPTISNVKEQFLPNNFYDVRIKTTMPVINPDISIGQQIRNKEYRLKENEVLIYKRELAKEVKTAYFNFLMSMKAVDILAEALKLVEQNLKVNQSLLENGKGLPAYKTRAESEVLNVQNQILNAKNSSQTAAAYFNFLLNRPLSDVVFVADVYVADGLIQQLMLPEGVTGQREELANFSIAADMTGDMLRMNRSFRQPRLNAFIDFAAQDFDFKVSRQSFFYLGGLQLQVPIYSGRRNLLRIEQTQVDLRRLQLQTERTSRQIDLAIHNARNQALNAYNSYQSAISREQAASQYFRLLDRSYREGVASFIEFLDARNQFTGARLESNIGKYRFLSGMADYERHAATYKLQ